MKFLVKATMPIESGNAIIHSPNWSQQIEQVLGDLRPEAAYFAVANGQRTIYAVVDLADSSELPRIVEPLWLALKADVEVIPIMDQADFGKAAAHIEQAAKKYPAS